MMQPEDSKKTQAPDKAVAGSGPTPSGPRQSMGTRILIIAAVIAIFIVAGLLVVLGRSCGGDQPAPQLTVTQSVSP